MTAISTVSFANKVDGASGLTGNVSAADMNDLKTKLNTVIAVLNFLYDFTFDGSGNITAATLKTDTSLPSVDLLPLFNNAVVVGGKITITDGTVQQLTAPATLTASSIISTGMTLNWAASQNATGYILQRSTAADFSTALTTVYTGSSLTFIDSGLAVSTTYYYRVVSTAAGYANSAYRTGSFATIAGSNPQLGTSANIATSNVTAAGITISWAAVNNATNYQLQRSLTADFASNTAVFNSSGLTFTDSGLTGTTTYYYRVFASASGYTSGGYANTSATTLSAGGGSGSGLTSLTAFDFVDTIQPVAAGSNSFKWSTTGGGSSDIGFAVKSSLKIPAGGTGYVQVQCLPNTVGSSSGWIGLFKDVVNYTGISDSEMSCRRNNAGSVGWRYTGISENGTANGALADNGYLRIRTDGTTIYLERSTDQTTWTLVVSRAQINQDLFIHLNIYGSSTYGSDQDKVSNIQYTGFVAA